MEKKTIFTFLAQGAVGGGLGFFVVAVFSVVSHPNYYNFLFLSALPMILSYGSAFGAMSAVFVWLPGVLLKRRLGFWVNTVIGMAALTVLVVAHSYFTEEPGADPWSFPWLIGFICVQGLPIALMTGSRINPWRLLILGSGPRRALNNFGSWLSIPFGLLLRLASLLCLLEALMTLAVWISYRRSNAVMFSARHYLPAIVLAFLYFGTSTYLSFRSPRKFFLVPIAVLLNLPLAVWIVNLRRVGTEDSKLMAYIGLVFISLWAVYTLGRLISPESVLSVINSSTETPEGQKVSLCGDYLVQL